MGEAAIWKNFIVLEGLDGAGTTTQLKALSDALKSRDIPCTETCEPTNSCLGQMIRSALRGNHSLSKTALAYLFAANRFDHLYTGSDSIRSHLDNGSMVICDRYLFSSLAYQSVDTDIALVKKLNEDFPLPQFLVYLDINPEKGMARISGRTERDFFETVNYQLKIREQYNTILKTYQSKGMKIIKLNAELNKNEITSQILLQTGLLTI